VPTLIIQAVDDPFMTAEVIPKPKELSSYVQLEVTQGGGHVGFVSGKNPFKPLYWLEERIPEFLISQVSEAQLLALLDKVPDVAPEWEDRMPEVLGGNVD
jgi:predicted alpha/beta-fold hydrolase